MCPRSPFSSSAFIYFSLRLSSSVLSCFTRRSFASIWRSDGTVRIVLLHSIGLLHHSYLLVILSDRSVGDYQRYQLAASNQHLIANHFLLSLSSNSLPLLWKFSLRARNKQQLLVLSLFKGKIAKYQANLFCIPFSNAIQSANKSAYLVALSMCELSFADWTVQFANL